MSPTIDPRDDDLLTAIARHGSREHILRQLEAAGAMGELDAIQVAKEEVNHVPDDPDKIAKIFVDAWDTYVEDTFSEESHDEWLRAVDETYGDQADAYLDAES
jgi:hypothetical protein